MLKYMARRLGAGVVLVVAATFLTFVLVYASGIDIARNILGEVATQADVDAKAELMGLNRPILVQYWEWLTGALRGDFGTGYFIAEPVASALQSRMEVTLSLVIFAIALTAILSVVLGVTAAVKGGVVDRIFQVFSVGGHVIPDLLVALGLVLVFGVQLRLLPATGFVPPTTSIGEWLRSITLPVIALTIGAVAATGQQVRGAMMDEMRKDYVRTLRSRGISERSIVYRYALRNAAGPALTVLGISVVGMLNGAIIVERIFALPGIGALTLAAGGLGDVPVLVGIVTLLVIMVVLVNLALDLVSAWLNPRKRFVQ